MARTQTPRREEMALKKYDSVTVFERATRFFRSTTNLVQPEPMCLAFTEYGNSVAD
jgi:hypothetical protein